MILVASADENWGIGKNGSLLIRIPADMKNFSAMTTGGTVILGRKTLETFPGAKPLKNRENIILTRNPGFGAEGAVTAHSIEELLELVRDRDPDRIFVIGGSSVYEQLLPYCDKAVITRIDYRYDADSHLPDLDKDPDWEIKETSEEQYCNDITYHFVRYERKKGN